VGGHGPAHFLRCGPAPVSSFDGILTLIIGFREAGGRRQEVEGAGGKRKAVFFLVWLIFLLPIKCLNCMKTILYFP
jgi:hypothetical protein